jgi:hypothetical protein
VVVGERNENRLDGEKIEFVLFTPAFYWGGRKEVGWEGIEE